MRGQVEGQDEGSGVLVMVLTAVSKGRTHPFLDLARKALCQPNLQKLHSLPCHQLVLDYPGVKKKIFYMFMYVWRV